MSYVVCLSFVTRVYCDKTAAVRIMQFSLNIAQCLNSLPAKFDDKGSARSGGFFDFAMLYLGNGAR